MARPREFDIDEALDAAAEAFWEHGYEATSLADLMEVMNLQKGSIYKAFGDKHKLFLMALERYLEKGYTRTRDAINSSKSAAEGIHRCMQMSIGLCNEQPVHRGCFAMNTVVELASRDEEVCKMLQAHFKRMGAVFASAIESAQEAGDFRRDESARELADYLMTFVGGLVAMSRRSLPKAKSERLMKFAFRTLQAE